MNPSVKRILHWAGSTLTIIGIVFVALRLNDYRTQIDFSYFDGLTLSVATGLALIYGIANILLALAWRDLLIHFGYTIQPLCAIRIYGLTQLAKYVPGNIMHLVSRQAMGLAAGIGGWQLAKASVWELGLLSITGTFFGVLVLPKIFSIITTPMAVAGFIAVLFLTTIVAKQVIGLTIARVIVLYAIFLTISGMLFAGFLFLLTGKSFITIQVFPYCGAFVLAWLAGLITPGAPAGIGVRELVLMKILGGSVSEIDLLLTILTIRVVTVSGDLLFFLFSVLLSRRKDENGLPQNNR